MKLIQSCILLVLSLVVIQRGASATVACEVKIPRCVAGPVCNWAGGADITGLMAFGSHKSPSYGRCPSADGYNYCTDDYFRQPSSWDYVASTSDYVYVWYATNPVSRIGYAGIAVLDLPLTSLVADVDWANITSIDYVDIDVAWSTYNQQSIYLNYWDPTIGSYLGRGYVLTGNFPDGTLLYWRLYTDPSTGLLWSKTKFATYREWTIYNNSLIDAAHPGGLFIQSITETVGFKFNGTSCPAPVIIH